MKRRFHDPNGHKICSTCLKIFPATKDYFHRNVRTKDNLNRICKTCDNARRSAKEKARAYHNVQTRCATCQVAFYASRAAINRHKGGGSYCSKLCAYKKIIGFGGISWNGVRQGEGNPNCKYSLATVIQVKKQLKNKIKPSIISRDLLVPYDFIMRLKHNRAWTHVTI